MFQRLREVPPYMVLDPAVEQCMQDVKSISTDFWKLLKLPYLLSFLTYTLLSPPFLHSCPTLPPFLLLPLPFHSFLFFPFLLALSSFPGGPTPWIQLGYLGSAVASPHGFFVCGWSPHCPTKSARIVTRRMAIANGTCVSFCNQPKAHFGLPWVRPWDYRGKCHMNEKRIQCLSNASQHVLIYLQPSTVSQYFNP